MKKCCLQTLSVQNFEELLPKIVVLHYFEKGKAAIMFRIQLVIHYGFVLEYESEEIQHDRDLPMEAIRQDGRTSVFAYGELKKVRYMIKEQLNRMNDDAFEFVEVFLLNFG